MKNNFFSLNFLVFQLLFALLQPVKISPPGSIEMPQTCTLAAPSSLNGEVTSSSSADLTWSAVSEAYAYSLVVTDNGSTFLQTVVSGTTITLGGLTTGHTYHYTVASMCDGSQISSYIIWDDINP